MRIWALWGIRGGFEAESPELMTAWDTYSVDGNYEGWEADCQKVKESWGSDLVAWRLIEHVVDEDFLKSAFEPPVETSKNARVIARG